MSNSYFDLKSVPGGIVSELNARASSAGLQWTARRFPWVHVKSFSSACGGGVLTSLGNTSLYQSGFIPKPVVTSVKVKKLGELGTTRKATIGLLAFTDDQLASLQGCYLIPGMTVRVQFGWSVSAAGGAPPGPYLGSTSEPEDICAMNALAAGNTAYDGLQGLVSNFTYNLNNNNQWEITFDIVAAAEGVMGTKIDSACCSCNRKVTSGEEEKQESMPQLLAFFFDMGDSLGSVQGSYSEAFSAGGKTMNLKYKGPKRMPDGAEPSLFAGNIASALKNMAAEVVGPLETEETFISFSALEAAINAYSFPQAGDAPTVQVKSGTMALRFHPALGNIPNEFKSADPRVCSLSGAIQGDKVILSEIMVNTIFLAKCFRQVQNGDKSLQTFLTTVLDGINTACGNLWDFDITNNAKCGAGKESITTIMVIDASVVQDKVSPITIPALPGNSAVREIKLDLKLTDAMKTQILYGNRASHDARSCTDGVNCDGISLKVFGLNGTVTDGARKTLTAKPKCSCETANPPSKAEAKDFATIFQELGEDVTDNTVNSAITALKQAYGQASQGEAEQTCKGAAVPFSFGFTTDGIGGFSFGQAVTTNRLPGPVQSYALYQITSVEHDLSPQDWTTTVSTVARWKG